MRNAMGMTGKLAEDRLLACIIQEAVQGRPVAKIEDLLRDASLDWQRFKRRVVFHELIPLAFISLNRHSSLLPQEVLETLKTQHYFILTYTGYLWQEFLRIARAFEQAGILVAPIKGIALLKDVYTDSLVRTMVDTDLVVKEDDLPAALRLFEALGYRKELFGLTEHYWRDKQTHLSFFKSEAADSVYHVDLHWRLDFKRKRYQVLPLLWDRLKSSRLSNQNIRLLSCEDLFFSIVLHQRRFGKVICLKYTCDVLLLLQRHAATFDWDYVLRESRKGRMNSSVFFLLYQAHLIMPEIVSASLLKKFHLPAWKERLIRLFIERNIFSLAQTQSRYLYLQSIFFLYDDLRDSIATVLYIPKEQFARYYHLDAYDRRTELLYQNRIFYIAWKETGHLVGAMRRRFRSA